LEFNNVKEIKSKIILIPLRKCCSTSSDVIGLIKQIFQDIAENKELKDFCVSKEMNKGIGKRFLDEVILKLSFVGLGFDFKTFFENK